MKDSFLIDTPVVHPVYGEGRIVEIRPGSKNPVAVKFVGGIVVDFKFDGKLSGDDPKTSQLNIKNTYNQANYLGLSHLCPFYTSWTTYRIFYY